MHAVSHWPTVVGPKAKPLTAQKQPPINEAHSMQPSPPVDMTVFPRRRPKRASSCMSSASSVKKTKRSSTRAIRGLKRPASVQSASHVSNSVGSEVTVPAHSCSTSGVSIPATTSTFLVKRAETGTGSTAAARGELMPLGPKLAEKFLKRQSDTA